MIVKRGSTRTVFLTEKLAFKVPSLKLWKLFLCGLLANMQEAEFSKTKWDALCPVVFNIPGGFLVVMPRATPLTQEEWTEAITGEIIDRLKYNEDYLIPVEEKIDSFGWLDGRLVAVDYGS